MSDLKDMKSIDSGSTHLEHGQPRLISAHLDAAAQVVDHDQPLEVSIEEDKRVLRLIDKYVLIPLMLVYFLQQLDKSSLSYTSVFGIVDEAKLVGKQYSWLSSVVYIAQLVCQPVSAYAINRLPLRWWISGNVLCWGIVVAASSAAHNFTGLLIARMFLGIFEATVAPTMVIYVQTFWRRREQTYRTMGWNASNSLAGTVGPLIAFGIGHINTSSIRPYQAIFLFCGCLTVACVPIVAYLLPDSPVTAKFLRHGNDRRIAIERLRANNTGVESKVWNWAHLWETFRDLKTYLWFALLFLAACPSGGIGAFGGLIVQSFGYSSFHTILFQMPFGALQFCCIVLSGYLTNKFRIRFIVIVGFVVFPITGAALLLNLPRGPEHKGPLLAAYYLVSILGCLQPLLYSWANLNAASHTKKITTTAVLFVAQCVGNIVGPLVYYTEEKPGYRTGLMVDLICWSALGAVALFTGGYLHWLNKKQERRREALGRRGKVVDTSLFSMEDVAKHKEKNPEAIAQNLHAFEELTDFENPDFIYVI